LTVLIPGVIRSLFAGDRLPWAVKTDALPAMLRELSSLAGSPAGGLPASDRPRRGGGGGVVGGAESSAVVAVTRAEAGARRDTGVGGGASTNGYLENSVVVNTQWKR